MELLIISIEQEVSLVNKKNYKLIYLLLNKNFINENSVLKNIVNLDMSPILIFNMEKILRLIKKVILIKLRLMYKSIKVFNYLTIKWFQLKIIKNKKLLNKRMIKGSIIKIHFLKMKVQK